MRLDQFSYVLFAYTSYT